MTPSIAAMLLAFVAATAPATRAVGRESPRETSALRCDVRSSVPRSPFAVVPSTSTSTSKSTWRVGARF